MNKEERIAGEYGKLRDWVLMGSDNTAPDAKDVERAVFKANRLYKTAWKVVDGWPISEYMTLQDNESLLQTSAKE